METFLSNVFIHLTTDRKEYFKNFIETHPEFKQRKFELKNIFVEYQKLNETAKKVMIDTIYHNLPSVSNMFEDTFKIKFPDIRIIYPLVLKRHDLVHRNGKTKDGIEVETNEEAIGQLIKDVSNFIDEIVILLDLK